MSEAPLTRTRSSKDQQPMRRSKKRKAKRKKKLLVGSIVTFAVLVAGFYLTHDLRLWLAGTLLTTQHSSWAKYTLVGEDALNSLRAEINNPEAINSVSPTEVTTQPGKEEEKQEEKPVQKELTEVVPVEKYFNPAHYFKGYVMKVSDPNRVHLIQTTGAKKNRGKPRGEWISEFSERTNAIGGVNASGFYDPNFMGYGSQAAGLVIVDGKLLQDYNPSGGDTVLGIDYNGKLITGRYTSKELLKMNIRDAMSFRPQLVVNGKNLFAGKDPISWGIAPRTAVGQMADGTILFIVIDGRQKHSIGASMKDMADLLEEYGAVNGMAMDGGTSSMMVDKGNVLTKSANGDPRGRWLPNAWMVY
ncbi:phosphodiester glycosidase family protein [Brevibacillus laterosporus]|uniref:Exopolysaccharide biosynthesis protein n=1 Tax=Brevibacillus laterosporus LMG 15441 TaxID=1042163 RepID=A0A075R6Z8_BRELA|nr:phosphodiester glycosidase family protein [Brevibacillus laterosporus]AIG27211.1 exopolysaccharide biosynthesis protein [Brevibacillus laterosporus LMG 15441]RJL11583.1 phosphodiester glycosidase family protein [Brevibacillus laterosporus]TPH09399.1 phosphodiester glycosidase family protein [Brevibacillus laterosporus]